MKNLKIIFDFDSTILKFETIEILADYALKNNKNKNSILEEVKKITNQAMEGKLDFSSALAKRIALLNITNENIFQTSIFLKNHLSIVLKKIFIILTKKIVLLYQEVLRKSFYP